jgi:hypothetical protein
MVSVADPLRSLISVFQTGKQSLFQLKFVGLSIYKYIVNLPCCHINTWVYMKVSASIVSAKDP